MPRICLGVVAGLLAFLLVSCESGEPGQESPIAFENAWIRAPVAGRSVTAAYCDITNRGEVAVVITGFASDDPEVRVEMHETTEEDGMMRMQPLAHVTIPAKATVSFAPGGKHLMLFGFDGSAAQAKLIATLDSGETLPVVFAIRPEQR